MEWYAPSVLFQVSAISDNHRGPRYAEAVLNSLHETNRRRERVCLELGSHQGMVGLFVRVPAGLVATFTHDFADAYPGCTLAVVPDSRPAERARALHSCAALKVDAMRCRNPNECAKPGSAWLEYLREGNDSSWKGTDKVPFHASLRLSPDVFPLKTHRQFEDLLHRELADPVAGLLSALRVRPKICTDARIAVIVRPCRASWYRSAC